MSCNLEEKIAERTAEFKTAIDEHNKILAKLNEAKENIIILQGRLTELQTLKEDSTKDDESVSPEVA
tara:strand:+ start:263 stop:463 length:201 start_codon:yes stop_codon:yes gene_type:complete